MMAYDGGGDNERFRHPDSGSSLSRLVPGEEE
jgi:hypothetical protein